MEKFIDFILNIQFVGDFLNNLADKMGMDVKWVVIGSLSIILLLIILLIVLIAVLAHKHGKKQLAKAIEYEKTRQEKKKIEQESKQLVESTEASIQIVSNDTSLIEQQEIVSKKDLREVVVPVESEIDPAGEEKEEENVLEEEEEQEEQEEQEEIIVNEEAPVEEVQESEKSPEEEEVLVEDTPVEEETLVDEAPAKEESVDVFVEEELEEEFVDEPIEKETEESVEEEVTEEEFVEEPAEKETEEFVEEAVEEKTEVPVVEEVKQEEVPAKEEKVTPKKKATTKSTKSTQKTKKESAPNEVEKIEQESTKEEVQNETILPEGSKLENSKIINRAKYIITNEDGSFRYTLKASNGEPMIVSEIYVSEQSARTGIETLKRNANAGKLDLEVSKDKHDLYSFRVITKTGRRTLATSANYKTETRAKSATESFLRFVNCPNVIVDESISTHEQAEEYDVEIAQETKGKFIIKTLNDGKEFIYQLLASNGQVISSSNIYKSKLSCKQACEKFRNLAYEGSFFIFKDKNDKFQYKLYNKQHRLVMTGEAYDDKQRVISVIESIKRFAKLAPIVDAQEVVTE